LTVIVGDQPNFQFAMANFQFAMDLEKTTSTRHVVAHDIAA